MPSLDQGRSPRPGLSTAAPPTPAEATQWGAVLSLMAAGVMAGAQVGKGAAALPVLQTDFGLSASAAAWFLSVMSAVGAVAGVGLGWLGQALGFRRQVLIGLLTILVTNAAGAAVGTAPWLLAARVGEGLGFALVVLAAPGLLPELSAPRHRRLVAGAWGAYMPVGSGLAALLVPVAITGIGWRGSWLVGAFLVLVVVLAVLRWVPRGGPSAGRPGFGGVARAARSPGVVTLGVVFGLYAGQYLAVLGLLPAMLVGGGDMSLATAGLVTGLAFLVNAPGNIVGAFLQHRGISRAWQIAGGSVCMALSVWGVQDGGLPLAVRIGCAMAFSFLSGVVPAAAFGGITAMTAGTTSMGAAVGFLMQGSSVGQLVVPPLVVAVGSAVPSWTARPATLACLAALAVVGGLVYRGREVPLRPAGDSA